MGTTFTTTAECYRKITGTDETPSTSTRPSSTTIDDCRADAYAAIYRIIGTGTDSNGVAKRIERALVFRMVMNILNGPRYSEDLTEAEIQELQATFDVYAVGRYEPDENAEYSG